MSYTVYNHLLLTSGVVCGIISIEASFAEISTAFFGAVTAGDAFFDLLSLAELKTYLICLEKCINYT